MYEDTIKKIKEQVERCGTGTGRFVKDMTLRELAEIDKESVDVILDERPMFSEDRKVQLIITDWSICCFTDDNEQDELFCEEFENFSTALENYLEVF